MAAQTLKVFTGNDLELPPMPSLLEMYGKVCVITRVEVVYTLYVYILSQHFRISPDCSFYGEVLFGL